MGYIFIWKVCNCIASTSFCWIYHFAYSIAACLGAFKEKPFSLWVQLSQVLRQSKGNIPVQLHELHPCDKPLAEEKMHSFKGEFFFPLLSCLQYFLDTFGFGHVPCWTPSSAVWKELLQVTPWAINPQMSLSVWRPSWHPNFDLLSCLSSVHTQQHSHHSWANGNNFMPSDHFLRFEKFVLLGKFSALPFQLQQWITGSSKL